jgi:hypothetical protein
VVRAEIIYYFHVCSKILIKEIEFFLLFITIIFRGHLIFTDFVGLLQIVNGVADPLSLYTDPQIFGSYPESAR